MTNQPRDFDVRTARTSELLIMLAPENLITCLFGADGEGMPDDRAAAKVEMQRVQALVIAEIDRRIPVPGTTAAPDMVTLQPAEMAAVHGVSWSAQPRRMAQVDADGRAIDAAATGAAACPPSLVTVPPAVWASLSDEERLAFLAAHPCCRHCGSIVDGGYGCQCNNDE